ncbi:delta24(24(1))-sterol reductase [Phakopsora pachyrhizi]|uniref:Delta(24(24(1)))-sterol reductase n=1 Tax=Phakopsora pachyrhizi TaxID=170000 RepID=A0AAV0AWE9_PHAPC|nr:delta24(24(1))-sterol reductase [Phakopsora pachyrhizi]KAI8454929.1 delta24(24(1))-sterol reductase [Phakopsora pachyrhizi]CAH7672641.1 delta24(24(1))-sterol reductase [Phakopsora pachyrhizi]
MSTNNPDRSTDNQNYQDQPDPTNTKKDDGNYSYSDDPNSSYRILVENQDETLASGVDQALEVGKFNPEADRHQKYEFGGPWGALFLMVLFPFLMYYFFICLWCYEGRLSRPDSLALGDISKWSSEFWNLVKIHTSPTWESFFIYTGFLFYQVFLAWFTPGVPQVGLPIPSMNGAKLPYYCNALASWYITLVTVFVLHVFGILRLDRVFDQLGHLMTIATFWGFAVSVYYYIVPILKGQSVRMSGNVIYDFFMGASLNPRIGHIDVKLFAEVRIPWILLFLIATSGSVKQYEMLGYVTPNSIFMVLATGLYVNACAKGEECIPMTWDMAYEKWGWLLCFWNFAGVAFTYCHSVIFITKQPPSQYSFSTVSVVLLYTTYLIAYYFFDTSNSQKARFKLEHIVGFEATKTRRRAFPQLPYGTIKNPKMIVLDDGRKKLLVDGWWAWCRRPNYTADFVQAMCWAISAGNKSWIPYFYPAFFFVMILHRCHRDFARCANKYGKAWEEYCERVPYLFE